VYCIAPPVKKEEEEAVMLQPSIVRSNEEREKRAEEEDEEEVMDVKLDPVISMHETDDENENKEEGIDKREKWQPDIFTVLDEAGEKEKREDVDVNVMMESICEVLQLLNSHQPSLTQIKEKGEFLERENSQYHRLSDNPQKEIIGNDICVSGVGIEITRETNEVGTVNSNGELSHVIFLIVMRASVFSVALLMVKERMLVISSESFNGDSNVTSV
jgi:hypothetical protein